MVCNQYLDDTSCQIFDKAKVLIQRLNSLLKNAMITNQSLEAAQLFFQYWLMYGSTKVFKTFQWIYKFVLTSQW